MQSCRVSCRDFFINACDKFDPQSGKFCATRRKSMLTLVLALSAIICPEGEEHRARALRLRVEGEKCGGPCGVEGVCGDGLSCVKPKTSKFSFAIMAPEQPGTCTATVEDAGRKLVGGATPVSDLDSEELRAAAKEAHQLIMQGSNALHPPALKRIVSATSQVVAGTKWVIVFETEDGSQHRVGLVDAPWLTPRYTVVKHEVL